MRIASDGIWFHQGAPIRRPEMVRLFSSILRREPNGGYVLVTPVEKLDIEVEDAPFVAIAVETEGSGTNRRVGFRLNTGEAVIADEDHALRLADGDVGPRPYVQDRKSVVSGKSVSVRLNLGCPRLVTKKKNKHTEQT